MRAEEETNVKAFFESARQREKEAEHKTKLFTRVFWFRFCISRSSTVCNSQTDEEHLMGANNSSFFKW